MDKKYNRLRNPL